MSEMVKFRVWGIPGDTDIIPIIIELVPTRRTPSVVHGDEEPIKISFPSVHIELSRAHGRTISRRAYWVNVSGTRRDYVSTLLAENFLKRGFKVDSWE